jgi:nitric oxide reductase subunit B
MVRVPLSERLPCQRHQRLLGLLFACALASNALAVVAGALASLAYAGVSRWPGGLGFRELRSIHTVFATAWIYVAGTAVVYAYLLSAAPRPPAGFRTRLRIQLLLWGGAAAGMLASLSLGRFSGREYLEAPWVWSVPVYAGWALFAWNFFSVTRGRLSGQPVHVYMWSTSLVLFLVAFAEAHLWLSAGLGERPTRDIGIQWKSYGTLVGTFNLLVYGGLSYLGCLATSSDARALSPTASFLFFVGLLNTFANYGHHTYHLPQSAWVHWISFLVSMTEVVVLVKLLSDLRHGSVPAGADPGSPVVRSLLRWANVWGLVLLGLAVILSVPQVNTLLHGTHVVVAHAMGSMVGIDSMALLACLTYLLGRLTRGWWPAPRCVAVAVTVANLGLLVLVAALTLRGAAVGLVRFLGPYAPAPPEAMRHFPVVFATAGAFVAAAFLVLDALMLLQAVRLIRSGHASIRPVASLPASSETAVGDRPGPDRQQPVQVGKRLARGVDGARAPR